MRLLIVDLSSVFFPAWHSGADKPIGHAYEVSVERVRRAARQAERVIVACDSGRSFRKDIAPSYKANRPDKEPALLEQLARVQETLEADGYAIAKADGYEADDVIATLVRQAEAMAAEVEVLSSDKDLLALVSMTTRVRSVQTDKLMGPDEVREKMKVPPHQVRDRLALTGDASDGVAGVKGIGEVNAAKLLTAFGTIGGIVEALDAKDADDNPAIRPAGIHAALSAANRDGSLALAVRLVTLRDDAPVQLEAMLAPREQKPLAPDARWDDGSDQPEDFEEESAPVTAPPPVAAPAPVPAVAPPAKAPAAPVAPEVEGEPVTSMVVTGGWSHALEPRSARDAHIIAKHLFNSRLFGQAYGNTDAVFATILAGRELGIPALSALRSIHVIDGKTSLSSHLIVGLVLRSGLAKYFRMVSSDDQQCTYETWRVGDPEPTRNQFTIADAERAGLLRSSRNGKASNYVLRPRVMLRKSSAAELARAVYPDVIANVHDPDELGADD